MGKRKRVIQDWLDVTSKRYLELLEMTNRMQYCSKKRWLLDMMYLNREIHEKLQRLIADGEIIL